MISAYGETALRNLSGPDSHRQIGLFHGLGFFPFVSESKSLRRQSVPRRGITQVVIRVHDTSNVIKHVIEWAATAILSLT